MNENVASAVHVYILTSNVGAVFTGRYRNVFQLHCTSENLQKNVLFYSFRQAVCKLLFNLQIEIHRQI